MVVGVARRDGPRSFGRGHREPAPAAPGKDEGERLGAGEPTGGARDEKEARTTRKTVKLDDAEAGGGRLGRDSRGSSKELAGEGARGVGADRPADTDTAVTDLVCEEGGEEAPSRCPGSGRDRRFTCRRPGDADWLGIDPRGPMGLGEAP